jgi:HSP20 family protein
MALMPIRRRRRPGWLGPLGDESMGDVFFDRLWNEWGNWFREDWAPAFNLSEREGKYTLTAELPGVDKDSISITMDGNVLTISGRKESTYEEEGSQYYMKECSYGAFSRSIRLPGEIEEDKVDATFKDGVLTLVMPHKEAPKSKKIEIK